MTTALKMQAGNLQIEICETRRAMGEAAARCGVARAKEVIAEKGEANIIFAAAPSQFELYESLLASDLDFSKVNAFHMDEYLGLAPDAPQGLSLIHISSLKSRSWSRMGMISIFRLVSRWPARLKGFSFRQATI